MAYKLSFWYVAIPLCHAIPNLDTKLPLLPIHQWCWPERLPDLRLSSISRILEGLRIFLSCCLLGHLLACLMCLGRSSAAPSSDNFSHDQVSSRNQTATTTATTRRRRRRSTRTRTRTTRNRIKTYQNHPKINIFLGRPDFFVQTAPRTCKLCIVERLKINDGYSWGSVQRIPLITPWTNYSRCVV